MTDGGLYSITFDNSPNSTAQVDIYNSSALPGDPPRLLYSIANLTDTVHNVTLKNLLDKRVNKYGQMNVDHFVVATTSENCTAGCPVPSGRAPVFPVGGAYAEVPMFDNEYHLNLTVRWVDAFLFVRARNLIVRHMYTAWREPDQFKSLTRYRR